MINVVDKETIRKLYHVQGKSIRWIARNWFCQANSKKKRYKTPYPQNMIWSSQNQSR